METLFSLQKTNNFLSKVFHPFNWDLFPKLSRGTLTDPKWNSWRYQPSLVTEWAKVETNLVWKCILAFIDKHCIHLYLLTSLLNLLHLKAPLVFFNCILKMPCRITSNWLNKLLELRISFQKRRWLYLFLASGKTCLSFLICYRTYLPS